MVLLGQEEGPGEDESQKDIQNWRIWTDRLVADIHAGLAPPHPKSLVGCHRRNKWTETEMLPWSMVSGGAFLRHVAELHTISTPVGPLDIWMTKTWDVIDFRGGPMRPWWWEDVFMQWDIVKAYTDIPVRAHVTIINEDRGKLGAYAELAQDQGDYRDRVSKAIASYTGDPPGRLAKNTIRAYHTCRGCPVKRRCDIADQTTTSGKDDWGRGYQFP